jgi:hypothetical protein
MIFFINWLTFISSAVNVVAKSLKQVIPEWQDLVKSNSQNKLSDDK